MVGIFFMTNHSMVAYCAPDESISELLDRAKRTPIIILKELTSDTNLSKIIFDPLVKLDLLREMGFKENQLSLLFDDNEKTFRKLILQDNLAQNARGKSSYGDYVPAGRNVPGIPADTELRLSRYSQIKAHHVMFYPKDENFYHNLHWMGFTPLPSKRFIIDNHFSIVRYVRPVVFESNSVLPNLTNIWYKLKFESYAEYPDWPFRDNLRPKLAITFFSSPEYMNAQPTVVHHIQASLHYENATSSNQ